MQDSSGGIHTSLVMSKTRVAPLKRKTIPRFELCGTPVLAQILSQSKHALNIPKDHADLCLDRLIHSPQLDTRKSTSFLGVCWDSSGPEIMELIPPERLKHVVSADNPADCASRGLFPSEILSHSLW